MSETNASPKKATSIASVSSDVDEKAHAKTEEGKIKNHAIPIIKLFRFATRKERCMLIIASIFSIGSGALPPVAFVIYGSTISRITGSLGDTSKLLEITLPIIHSLAYMGTASLLAAYISSCLWVLTGEAQARRIRSLYLHSVLKQDMSWFDLSADGSLNTRLVSDTQIIQDGISEKFGLFVSLLGQFLAGFVVAFSKGYKMALVLLALLPLYMIIGKATAHFISKYFVKSQNAYAKAGAVAEQAFQSIRTIYSFTLQKRFLERYEVALEEALGFSIKRGWSIGLGFAMLYLVLFCGYGLSLWFGSGLVMKGELDGPSVFVVFLSMLTSSLALLKMPSNLVAISSACGAAYKIFEIIDRVPDIDLDSNTGMIPACIEGAIEFKNVSFNYPTRPDTMVLKGLNLRINPGQTVAFVGPSGSGKSTSIELIQRFYNVISGEILIDNNNIKNLDVKWLRQQIGVVSQEPVLFNMTIRQNLLMGVQENIPEKEIIAACKEANCHTFITRLPEGYDTLVGEQGGMLSGGQKQRIAIARAILKNPMILLLDEATSALDTLSERLVQSALDRASATRTTIIVAHRLSTIINVDNIVVFDRGEIIEQGTHQQLIELNGTYADFVEKQAINIDQNGDSGTIESSDYDSEELLQREELEVKQLMLEKEMRSLSIVMSHTSTHSAVDASTDEKVGKGPASVAIDAYDSKIAEQKRIEKQIKQQHAPIWKVLKHMRHEWNYLGVGTIGSALSGCVFPLYGFCFSRIIVILSVPGQDIQPSPLGGTNLFAFLFVIVGITAFIGNLAQFTAFEIAGEKFTRRLRAQVFEAFMKQEIGFFDLKENNTGALTSRLAVETTKVNEMITKVWGDIANLVATIVCCFSISFSHSWALSLIMLCLAPFVSAATAYEFRIQKGFDDKTKEANAESGQIAGEAIREVRTVAALNKQAYFEKRYHHATERPHKLAMKKAYLSSIAGGFGKGIVIYTTALGFFAGLHLIVNGSIDFQQMLTCMIVITIASEGAGRSTTFAAAYSKAKYAAIASYEIIERKPEIDPELEGLEPTAGSIAGDIEFQNIKFAYPSRLDTVVFNGEFNLKCQSGQSIALVGPSGHGKSTVIGMLQRWYDPFKGTVSLDQHDVKSYSVYNLRSHMALVGQEPVLFDMTIGENIRFGVEDHNIVSQQEVEDACKAANIYAFISGLPQGCDTRVGDKGSQLSGGQKQRIAIARALIRKPKVLLLDEATSALDSGSEQVVQEALDNILQEGGRTTITIAHRLSTIKNADLICVIKDGRVIEQGTHWELLKLNDVYSGMVQEQSLSIL